jgi:hypothetical protein
MKTQLLGALHALKITGNDPPEIVVTFTCALTKENVADFALLADMKRQDAPVIATFDSIQYALPVDTTEPAAAAEQGER